MIRFVVALSLVFVAAPAAALTFVENEITCPIGGEKFTARQAASGTAMGQNLDRRSFGATASPWPLAKCRGNGFVLFRPQFEDAELAVLRPIVESPAYREAAARETDYYLAATLMRALDAPPETLATVLLQASWEAEGDARYPRYAAEALAEFERYLAAAPADPADDAWVGFMQLAGELERRLGRFDAAQKRFDALLPQVAGHAIEPLVRQELTLIAARDSGTHAVEPPDEAPGD